MMRTLFFALALALTMTAVAPANVVFGIRIRVGASPVSPSTEKTKKTSCTARATQFFAYALQATDAVVVANARRHGSLPGTWYASTDSAPGNIAQYALVDWIVGRITKHWSCASRTLIWFGLGASAENNASVTQFPSSFPVRPTPTTAPGNFVLR